MAQDKSGKGEMGFWTCSALVIGNMVGSGVFLLPASLTPYGGLSLIGWLVSSAGAILLALTFRRLDWAAMADPEISKILIVDMTIINPGQ